MPSATNKIQELREESDEGDIPYISKSRLTTYEKCPRKFYYTYIEERRPDETDAMRQGTRVHYIFETYYENLVAEYESGNLSLPAEPHDLTDYLPDDTLLWADWQDFISNFIAWEMNRVDNSESVEEWLPVGIEEEAWKSQDDKPPWMGFADLIVQSSTVNEIDDNDGVVIIDFKTGKTPKEKYRNTGIFLEGEFYGMIFSDEFDVSGVAGFYPKEGDFLVTDLSKTRRDTIRQIISDINEVVGGDGEYPDEEAFEHDPQPLCKWGEGEENECDFYGECPSNWGEPAKNKVTFVEMVERGDSDGVIANYFDCPYGAVNYWKWKFDL